MRIQKCAIESHRRILRCLLGFLCLSVVIFCIPRVSALEEKKRVLFISSYSEEFLSIPEQIKGIEAVFAQENISLFIEYMDTKRIDTKENKQMFYDLLSYKLNHLPPYDAVLIGDDNALDFALQHGDELFGGLPMVFLGINDIERAKMAHATGKFTGVIEIAPLKENIEIALRFNPNATKVVGIVDNSLTGIGDEEQFYAIENEFPQLSFSDLNGSELTTDEMALALSLIGDDTIVLYLSFYMDYLGQNITIDQGVDFLARYVKVPIYRQSIGGVGSGLLGGKMVSYEESGKLAAQMIGQLLSGQSMADVDLILESPNFYFFDYKLLNEYGIDEKLIPKDAILVNKPYSFYQENREYVNGLLALMAVFAIITVIMFLDNLRRIRIEKQLQVSLEKLGQANDELTVSEEEIRAQYEMIQERIDEIELLNQKFEIAVESTSAAVFELSLDGKDLYLSKSFSKIVNEPIWGHVNAVDVAKMFFREEEYAALVMEINRYRSSMTDEIDIQLPMHLNHGEVKWVLIKGKELIDAKGYSQFIHGIILDSTKVKKQEQDIVHLAYHDHLTNLPNRINFQNYLQELIDGNIPSAVMLLDLDNFKTVNDTLGHTYGDLVLQAVAKRLEQLSDSQLFVSRFGGDEFLILCVNVQDRAEVDQCLKNIDATLREDFYLQGQSIHLQYTIGISCFPEDGSNIDEIIMNADTALYQAKRTGKNKRMYFLSDMKKVIYEKAEIEAVLRTALAEDGFELVYQPQISVEDGEIASFEALLRLKNRIYPPNKFIAVAEEVGLIIEIGRWVTSQVVLQLAHLRDKGFVLKPIAINFSNKQLYDTLYVDFLAQLLEEHDIDPVYIDIEITESILVENDQESIDFLQQLKKTGITLSLDDFGTGYSSINSLTYIPVDKVKLDKSLCDRFLETENSKVIDSIISLVHSLNLTITSEGIEEVYQYEKLKEVGCDYVQGYLFARPLSVCDMEEIYDQNLMNRVVREEVLQ